VHWAPSVLTIHARLPSLQKSVVVTMLYLLKAPEVSAVEAFGNAPYYLTLVVQNGFDFSVELSVKRGWCLEFGVSYKL
ncbi:hypothetical protein BaRGS_00039423, partial [Batillaria attramentaria]